MPPEVFQAIANLTLTSALAFAVVAFAMDYVRSGRAADKREAVLVKGYEDRISILVAGHGKQLELVVAERDMWKSNSEKHEQRADSADERADKIVEAFETVYAYAMRTPNQGLLGKGTGV